jgi:hypothetical protein
MNLIEIAQAWISSYNPTPEQQQIADSRISICNTCEYKKHIAVIDTWVCSECNCPLKKKIFSSNKMGCPAKKWTK